MIFIGIDPGGSGGIALLREGEDAQAFKMPDTERDVWCVLRDLTRVEALHDLADFFGKGGLPAPKLPPVDPLCFALIEQVSSMPGQGVASTFKFGRSYGSLRMALVATGVPFESVLPRKWQQPFGLLRRKDESKVAKKNRHKARAQELFPHLKVTHAIADALLIAEHAKRSRVKVRWDPKALEQLRGSAKAVLSMDDE